MLFWPTVRDRVSDGVAMSRLALDQESTGKRLLNELVHVTPDNEEFDTLCHTVAGMLREHIAYEENIVWPKLRRQLAADEAARLGDQVRRAQRRAPSRPHPHIPSDPGLLRRLGPIAAAMDRARNDVVR